MDILVPHAALDFDKRVPTKQPHFNFGRSGWKHSAATVEKITNAQRQTEEQFISKARIKHGNKYDYSRVLYRNRKSLVEIVCSEHGSFMQTPGDHLFGRGVGSGCTRCARVRNVAAQLSNGLSFIAKAHVVHGHVYAYTQVDYQRSVLKVKIMCSKHGLFEQTPNDHLSGKGCPLCAISRIADLKRVSTAEWLIKAQAKHGHTYDYSQVQYVHNALKIEIICREHGSFWQAANNHLAGHGCPICAISSHGCISKAGTQWLDSLQIKGLLREWSIPDTRYNADGYDPITNTIYEFHGSYWHGHPDYSGHKDANELYRRTLRKEARIKELGYKLVVVWEHEQVRYAA